MAVARVANTSAWIEWLTGSALGRKLSKQLPDKPKCIVPTIEQLELSKWLVRELGEDQVDQVIAYTRKCVVVPLNTTIALFAADLHRQHKLATADAIVRGPAGLFARQRRIRNDYSLRPRLAQSSQGVDRA